MTTTSNRRTFLRATGAVAVSSLAPAVLASRSGPLRAGAAVVDMTPFVGVSMQGPIGGNGTVRTVHDPLHARCLVLDNGSTRLAICVCDATVIWENTVKQAKRLVQEQVGLPPANVLISATHSHAAPRLMGIATDEIDKKYYSFVERQIAESITSACENLAPAKVGWGVGAHREFVELRRFRIKPGSNGPNPFGESTDRAWMYGKPETRNGAEGRLDPHISVLSVRDADDRPLAVLANYSIHYTTGYARNAASADYYPCFANRLGVLLGADRLGPPFVGIMSNGNSGNIGPARGSYEGMRKVGESLAAEVLEICDKTEYCDRVPLAVREARLELSVRRPDEKRLQWAHDVLSGKWTQPAHHWRDVYARNAVDLASFTPTVSPTFQAIRIGQLGIASNPNEMYAETGLEIKDRSPLDTTFNIQLANGYHGYLPPPEQHALAHFSSAYPTPLLFGHGEFFRFVDGRRSAERRSEAVQFVEFRMNGVS